MYFSIAYYSLHSYYYSGDGIVSTGVARDSIRIESSSIELDETEKMDETTPPTSLGISASCKFKFKFKFELE